MFLRSKDPAAAASLVAEDRQQPAEEAGDDGQVGAGGGHQQGDGQVGALWKVREAGMNK